MNRLTASSNSMKLPAMRNRAPIALISFFILAVLCGAGLRGQNAESVEFLKLPYLSGVRGGGLAVAVDAPPTTFNQLLTTGVANRAITERLSADLVHINRETLQLEPALATRWEKDAAGRVFTLHLRRGVRFSDGVPFTADDVLFTFRVLSDPKTQCPIAGQIQIDGAFPSLTKVDSHTVRMRFPRPVGMGLRMLDSVSILPRHRLLKAYQEGRFQKSWGLSANPQEVVGLGPFRLKSHANNISVTLERNPHYWKVDRAGQRLPYLDTIAFATNLTSETAALRFKHGELDLASSPVLNPGDYAMLLRERRNFVLRDLGPGLTMDYVWFNLNSRPGRNGRTYVDSEKSSIFQKSEFRTAVSYALDRQGIARAIYQGLGVPQYSLVSSGNKEWHNPSVAKTEYNPARARALLAGIGLRDTNGDGTLEYGTHKRPLELILFTSRDNSRRERMAQVIRDNLAKVGIRVGLQYLLPGEIAARFMNTFEYEAILFGFTATDIAPDLQTDLWHSSGALHFWQPGQPQPQHPWEGAIDALITRLTRSADHEIRQRSFAEAQQIWAREMPAIPTVTPNVLVGWNNRIGNLRPSILTPHLIWNAEEITRRRP